MKKKYILIIILVIVNLLLIGGVKTYSAYRSGANGNISLNLAKIVFNSQELTSLSLDLDDLVPGSSKDFLFQVKNFNERNNSEITIGYKISIETLRLIPLTIKLYEDDNLLLTCDGNSIRNNGVILCTSEEYILDYKDNVVRDYKIEVSFPLNDEEENLWNNNYSDMTDYVDVYIDSYQKK